jgi:hypothetical protein
LLPYGARRSSPKRFWPEQPRATAITHNSTDFDNLAIPPAPSQSIFGVVADEAEERGYHFDVSKIAVPRGMFAIPVTKGQLAYELTHLKQKLRQRDPKRLQLISKREPVKVNSTFKAVEGPKAPWERTAKDRARTQAKESRTRAGSSND